MNFIKVSYGTVWVKLAIKGGAIQIEVIKTYFPEANGITYKPDGEKVRLEIISDKISLPDHIIDYEI